MGKIFTGSTANQHLKREREYLENHFLRLTDCVALKNIHTIKKHFLAQQTNNKKRNKTSIQFTSLKKKSLLLKNIIL
jgi:hypothetical protein